MPLPNETCAGATVISSLPYSDSPDATDSTTNGPDPSCETGVEYSMWWTYTPVSDTPIKIDTPDDEEWGTILAIYTGSCGSLVEVVCNENFPQTYNFLASAGIQYFIQVSLYPGSPSPNVVNFAVSVASLPSTPVLAASSTTSRTVTLTWGALTDTDTVDIERSTDNVNWTVVAAGISPFSPYIDRSLTASTVYYHRMRGEEDTLGYGSYSNTTTTTTAVDGTGIIQCAVAIGGTGSFGAGIEMDSAVTFNALPPIFEVDSLFQLWTHDNQQVTQPGGVGTVLLSTAKLILKYWHGTSSDYTIVISDYVLETQKTEPAPSTNPSYRNLNNRIEIFAYTGSADELTGTHAADGFIRVKLNNVTIFDVQDIALGRTGQPKWTNVVVGPSGAVTLVGAIPQQNGGMSHFYLGDELDGVGNIFNYDFSTMEDADLFNTLNASAVWYRRNGISGLDQGMPSIFEYLGQTKLDKGNSGSVGSGWMSLIPSALLDPPDRYPDPGEDPPDTTTGIFRLTDPVAFPLPPIPTDTHDTYNGSVTKKIPNPTIRTALLGE